MVNSTTEEPTTSTDDGCLEQENWIYFVSSSFIIFLGGACLILLVEIFSRACQSGRKKKSQAAKNEGDADNLAYAVSPSGTAQNFENPAVDEVVKKESQDSAVSNKENELVQMSCLERGRNRCEVWISSQSVIGKVMLSLSVILSAASFLIYVVDATRYNPLDKCIPWELAPSQYVDFGLHCFFLITFILRFFAAKRKLKFWMGVESWVDYCTIPPAFVGIIIGRQWLGLRFMRGLRLLQVPELLQYLSILRTNNSIRFAQLCCSFMSIWLCSAGFVHAVETAGDFWNDYENAQTYTFWEYVYFLMVTMSTVGYGDIYCETIVGRIFITIFIAGALAMFASVIPVFIEIFGNRDKYAGEYEPVPGSSHVVVCGHINYHSVTNFLQDFMHEDRIQSDMKYVFIDDKDLSLDMAALFKRHFREFQYLRGTIMHCRDIRRTKLETAEACIILANHQAEDPDEEDANNIMRVISVKNSFPEKRVLVQLLLYNSKAFCLNLPNWSQTDTVVCSSEIKLGFMAQGCVAPGSSTLLSNLFVARSAKQSFAGNCDWLELYTYGAGLEVYTTCFSKYFHGQPFPEAAKFCYENLDLLLIACVKGEGADMQVVLNPGPRFPIHPDTKGFFVCDEESEIQRIKYYCDKCHKDFLRSNNNPPMYNRISRECSCSSRKVSAHGQNGQLGKRSISTQEIKLEEKGDTQSTEESPGHDEASDMSSQVSVEKFDSMGLFHWCPPRNMSECSLKSPMNKHIKENLKGHIIMCLFKHKNSPILGLNNFIMPLRSSNLAASGIMPIVLVGEEEYLAREWKSVGFLPNVYVMPEYPRRLVLREVNIFQCKICVISAGGESKSTDDFLKDKEAILCSLDIKTMQRTLTSPGSKRWNYLRRHMLSTSSTESTKSTTTNKLTGESVTMLTEFVNDSNVQFLDQDDDDDPDCPLYLTQPFSCGRAFTSSVLDSILCTAFFNNDVLGLIRALVTGTTSSEVEHVLAEGAGLSEGFFDPAEMTALRNRCHLVLTRLDEGVLAKYGKIITEEQKVLTYGQLLVRALCELGILCLGLYRLVDPSTMNEPNLPTKPQHRFVATNPPRKTSLRASDQVYALIPFKVDAKAYAHDYSVSEYKKIEQATNVLRHVVNKRPSRRAASTPSLSGNEQAPSNLGKLSEEVTNDQTTKI